MSSGNQFTILFDDVVAEVGLAAGAVYGVIWRYCQRRDKECYASQETLASHLHISRQTLNKHLGKLVEAGFVKDVTPDRKGQTRTYRLSDKRNDGTLTTDAEPVKDTDSQAATSVKHLDSANDACKGTRRVAVKVSDTRITSEEKEDAYASGGAEQGADAPAPTRKGASRARFTCTDAQADELVGHFSGVSLIERPMCVTSGQFAYFNKQWKTPVKTLYDTVGNMEHAKYLITHTVRLMQQKGLTITDPNSIMKMANAERRKIRRAGGFVDSANGVYKGAG